MKQIIFNLDVYFKCAGHCAGCFLSQQERNDSQFVPYVFQNDFFTYLSQLIQQKITPETELLIIGFGRGNILSAEEKDIILLAQLIKKLDVAFDVPKKFEISTSLIDKLPSQLQKAEILLKTSPNLYFNVVVNSEILSPSFWKIWRDFYQHNQKYRVQKSIIENGDILVLNINPDNLPDIEDLYQKLKIENKIIQSPINVAFFPYQRHIVEEDLKQLHQWIIYFDQTFKDTDVNYKNFLLQMKNFEIGQDVNTIKNYFQKNQQSYVFIDKYKNIKQGSLSIMGEIDYHRLKDKFDINVSIHEFLKLANRNKVCIECDYQKECLLSGAYLVALQNDKMKRKKYFFANQNMASNITVEHKKEKTAYCLNGYQALFQNYLK